MTQGGRPVPHLVPARADCTITIHFSAKTPAVLHFVVPNGVMQAGIQSYVDDVEILPLPVGTPAADAQDYSFAGLVPAGAGGAGREPVLSPRRESEFAVAQPEQTLYAVYRYFATPAGTTPAFHELTEAPEDWSGTYVLSAEGHALLCDGSVTGATLGSSEAAVPFADAGLAEEDGGAARRFRCGRCTDRACRRHGAVCHPPRRHF